MFGIVELNMDWTTLSLASSYGLMAE